ncbi:MAG: hypothetical protein ACREQ5_11945, partial [Candidatus Dormibacteria bacterium]
AIARRKAAKLAELLFIFMPPWPIPGLYTSSRLLPDLIPGRLSANNDSMPFVQKRVFEKSFLASQRLFQRQGSPCKTGRIAHSKYGNRLSEFY